MKKNHRIYGFRPLRYLVDHDLHDFGQELVRELVEVGVSAV